MPGPPEPRWATAAALGPGAVRGAWGGAAPHREGNPHRGEARGRLQRVPGRGWIDWVGIQMGRGKETVEGKAPTY